MLLARAEFVCCLLLREIHLLELVISTRAGKLLRISVLLLRLLVLLLLEGSVVSGAWLTLRTVDVHCERNACLRKRLDAREPLWPTRDWNNCVNERDCE